MAARHIHPLKQKPHLKKNTKIIADFIQLLLFEKELLGEDRRRPHKYRVFSCGVCSEDKLKCHIEESVKR